MAAAKIRSARLRAAARLIESSVRPLGSPNIMLKKKERLTRKEFSRFFAAGRRFHAPSLSLIFAAADDFHGAVVAGKKVAKQAVGRNRLRRRVYSILYRLSREKNLKGVYIILTKPPAAAAKFSDLKSELARLVALIPNP